MSWGGLKPGSSGTHRALLLVQFQDEKDENDEPRQERWGIVELADRPMPGDFLDVDHDGECKVVVVRRVRHRAVLLDDEGNPVARLSPLSRSEPYTIITADWHWTSDL